MSLNGLDTVKVNEAYQATLGVNGGWFLLRYISRDEVDVLKGGNGGLAEVRDTIAQYEEKSPLYGLVQYRRKKVFLKYIPEGTSRLLQARLVVHVQAILEKFTHDTVVNFSTSSELSETALSSTIPLRTASASSKSSISSLRRKRLAEIAEISSENQDSTVKGTNVNIIESPTRESKSASGRLDHSGYSPERTRDRSLSATRAYISSSGESRNLDRSLPEIPKDFIGESGSATEDIENNTFEGRENIERRQSSQSARPLARDSYGGYSHWSRAKLGPRPSLNYSSPSSTTSSYPRQGENRPVSSLPAGVRIPLRKAVAATRPQPHESLALRNTPELPRLNAENTQNSLEQKLEIDRPVTRANSITSVLSYKSEQRHASMTPEKQRLMKALQIRQQKMAKHISKEVAPADPAVQPVDDCVSQKRADNASTLRVLDTVSLPEDDSDVVHVSMKDLGDSLQPQTSPISITESSEGPSTQASSVVDAEDSNGNHVLPHDTIAHEALDGQPTSCRMVTASSDGPYIPSHATVCGESLTASELSMPFNQHYPFSYVEPHEVPLPAVTEDEQTSLQIIPSSKDGLISITNISPPTNIPPCSTRLLENPPDIDLQAQRTLEDLSPQHIPPNELNRSPSTEPLSENLPLPDSPITNAQSAGSLSTDTSAPSNTIFIEPNLDQGKPLGNPRLSIPDATNIQNTGRKTKRRGLLEPIQVQSTGENSDDNYLSDDSFMEELQSATVQEAKPISVSRSPITPVFPRSPRLVGGQSHLEPSKLAHTTSDAPSEIHTEDQFQLLSERPYSSPQPADGRILPKTSSSYRTVSGPIDLNNPHSEQHLSPRLSERIIPRSLSASPTPKGKSENGSTSLSRKIGVSTGISQRIKALEKLSSSPTSPNPASLPTPVLSPAFVSGRKTSVASPISNSIPLENDRWSFRKKFSYPSPSPSPVENKSAFTGESSIAPLPVTTKKPQPQSVSITARIVRENSNCEILSVNPSEPVFMNLHHSPLIVERQSLVQPSIKSTTKSPKSRDSSVASNSSSIPESKRDTIMAAKRDSFTSRRSTPSRKGSDGDGVTVTSETSSNGPDSAEGSKEEKRESRRGRLFKRMSSFTSASRRSIVHALSPTVKEEDPIIEHQQLTNAQAPCQTVDIGDVNIQFPDTLLWKRRHMKIDDQGFLILAPSKADTNSKITTKRYHLTDFRPPYIPEQDQQELPNSVILDFNDSSTLQCACENLSGQTEVMRALVARRAYYTLNDR